MTPEVRASIMLEKESVEIKNEGENAKEEVVGGNKTEDDVEMSHVFSKVQL